MIDGRVVLAAVLVFAMIGFGTTLVIVDDAWEWLTREGYSNYIIAAVYTVAAIIGEIILYVRQGWKAAVIAPLAIIPILAIFAGILWAVDHVSRESHVLIGIGMLVVAVIGLGVILERLAERNKS